jgi:hypothetical protein
MYAVQPYNYPQLMQLDGQLMQLDTNYDSLGLQSLWFGDMVTSIDKFIHPHMKEKDVSFE